MTYFRSGVHGEVCCDSWREESQVGLGVSVQGRFGSLLGYLELTLSFSLFRRVREGTSWS